MTLEQSAKLGGINPRSAGSLRPLHLNVIYLDKLIPTGESAMDDQAEAGSGR